MLITNDQHKPKGETFPTTGSLGILQTRKTIFLKDDEGNDVEHSVPQFKRESNTCPIDQDLCADDFSLSTMIKLGNNLQTIKAPINDPFIAVDITMANLHLLNSPQFQKIEPSEPTSSPNVEPSNISD